MRYQQQKARQARLLERLDYWEEEHARRLAWRDGYPSSQNEVLLAEATRVLASIEAMLHELENAQLVD